MEKHVNSKIGKLSNKEVDFHWDNSTNIDDLVQTANYQFDVQPKTDLQIVSSSIESLYVKLKREILALQGLALEIQRKSCNPRPNENTREQVSELNDEIKYIMSNIEEIQERLNYTKDVVESIELVHQMTDDGKEQKFSIEDKILKQLNNANNMLLKKQSSLNKKSFSSEYKGSYDNE